MHKSKSIESTNRRKIDEKLWHEIQTKATGNESDRLEAVGLILEKREGLPAASAELLLKLAQPDQPSSVRLAIVSKLKESHNLPAPLFAKVIDTLGNDPDPEVKSATHALYNKFIQPLDDLSKNLLKITELVKIPRLELPDLSMLQLQELQQRLQASVSAVGQSLAPYLTAKNFVEPVNLTRQLIEGAARSAQAVLQSYYPQSELEAIGKIYPKFKKSPEARLFSRLEKCKAGRRFWREYQKVCRSILTYALVPPLGDPIEESTSRGSDQRMDLIFHIPYDAKGFWAYIQMNYKSLALIIDCKNYVEPLRQNQVTITAKYLGERRLGLFGIILCRKGLGESASREQQRLWVSEGKMLLALGDDDLKNMLNLKGSGEDPSKVIDSAMRTFRQGV